MMFVNTQIVINMSSVHSMQGGSEYPEPFLSVVRAMDVLAMDIFEVPHHERAHRCRRSSHLLYPTPRPYHHTTQLTLAAFSHQPYPVSPIPDIQHGLLE